MLRDLCVLVPALCVATAGWGQTPSDQPAAGQAPAAAPAPTGFFNKLKYFGSIDVNATHNFNDPVSKINTYRNFDYHANTVDLNHGEFGLEYAPAQIGFRVDVGGGGRTNWFTAQSKPATGLAMCSRPTSA